MQDLFTNEFFTIFTTATILGYGVAGTIEWIKERLIPKLKGGWTIFTAILISFAFDALLFVYGKQSFELLDYIVIGFFTFLSSQGMNKAIFSKSPDSVEEIEGVGYDEDGEEIGNIEAVEADNE